MQVRVGEMTRDMVRPRNLAACDGFQRRPSTRRERRELRSLMRWIIDVGQEAVSLEEVGRSLDALACQPHPPADVGDGSPTVLQRAQDLPTRAGLSKRTRQRITGTEKTAVQAEDFENQLSEGLPCLSSRH